MLGSDDANLLVNAAHQGDGAEGEGEGGDGTVAAGNHNRKANNVLDTPWYAFLSLFFCVCVCLWCRLYFLYEILITVWSVYN